MIRITRNGHRVWFLHPLNQHCLCSTSAATSAKSRLYDFYGFRPPQSVSAQDPCHSIPRLPTKEKKKKKPPCLPRSSLEYPCKKPFRSELPFDFRFSYTETNPSVRPIGLREPKYSPFGPGRLDRPWTGVCAPAIDLTVTSVDGDGTNDDLTIDDKRLKIREMIQGEALTTAERRILVDMAHRRKTKRQINLGRDGLTHNMLSEIHNHWKRAETARIRCLGVPTVDMRNVCHHLEDKSFGKIIHRHGSLLILYRGRNYNPKKRPIIPLMMWKPREPVYPRLIKTTIEGLSIEESKEMRKKGLRIPALLRLAKNGYYANLVPMVRDAFIVSELVRIDCQGLEKSDSRKIGLKLRDMVPCVLVTFEKEQIVVWRGKDYQPIEEDGCFFPDRLIYDDPQVEAGDSEPK